MKTLLCDCVNPDFERLGVNDVNGFTELIDEAEEITKEDFLSVCAIQGFDLFGEFIGESFDKYPQSFSFHKNGDIYFFTNSMIEYFYID